MTQPLPRNTRIKRTVTVRFDDSDNAKLEAHLERMRKRMPRQQFSSLDALWDLFRLGVESAEKPR